MDFEKEVRHYGGRRTSLLTVLLIGGDGRARLDLLFVVSASRASAGCALLRFSTPRGGDATSSQIE